MNDQPPQRYGDWNAKNRELLQETERLGGNPYALDAGEAKNAPESDDSARL